MCILCEIGSRDPSFHAFDPQPLAAGDATNSASLARPSLSTAQAAGHIAEVAWSSPGSPITYAFRATGTDATFQRFTSAQIQGAELALQQWSDVANVRFQRVGGGTGGEGAYSNNATILLNGLNGGQSFAYAYLPGNRATTSLAGDVFLNVSVASLNDMSLGNYGFMTMLHEIGHAVGLTHPGAYDASQDRPISYSADAEYAEDSRQYTVMSYFGAAETGANHGQRYAVTPLLHDIAAIQSLYGANIGTRTGDTVYGFNANADRPAYQIANDSQRAVFAIWDAGGTDTLDLSGYGQTQTINLAANGFSDAGGLVRNVSIASSAVIENAVGGSGADRVSGNDVDNGLRGRGGSDVLIGLGGNDRLEGEDGNDELDGGNGDDVLLGGPGDDLLRGGIGADTLSGSSGRDTFVLATDDSFDAILDFVTGDDLILLAGLDTAPDGAQIFWRESSRVLAWDPDGAAGSRGRVDIGRLDLEGTLTASNFAGPQRFAFIAESTTVVTPSPTAPTTPVVTESRPGVERRGGDGNDSLTGEGGDDRLYGQRGEDVLRGEGGNDEIHGDDGNDRLEGGDGADRLTGGHGNDRLFGGHGRDTLNGGDGDDELRGEDSDDELSGEDGTDRLDGGDGNDRMSGHGGDDEMIGGAGDDEAHGDGGNDLVAGHDGNDRLHGGEGEDRLFGDGGGDELRGNRGNDRLDGGDGDDRLFGDEGQDELHAGSGRNWLEGGDGEDRLFGRDGEDELHGGSGHDRLEGGNGADRLFGGANEDELRGDGGRDLLAGQDGNDRLHGGDEDDQLFGDSGGDELHGDGGNDRLDAGHNDDRLFGDDGDDFLEAGDGNDRLEGGNGNDRLAGGRGDDALIGGGGADTFVFARDQNRDVVMDFRSEDVIEFRDGLFGNFQSVLSRATQSGSDTIIDEAGTQFVINDVLRSSLMADDFHFA